MAVRVLAYLVTQAGRIVEFEELRRAVWKNTRISRTVLRVYVRYIRQALGDDVNAPRYLETVGREGYRFLGISSAPASPPQPSVLPLTPRPSLPSPAFIGREAALQQLRQAYDQACAGQRQLVFVGGELGIGKTALLDRFVAELSSSGEVWIGRGQCIAQYGTGEAYLPLLDILGQWMRDATKLPQLRYLLLRYAPDWLAHFPWLGAETIAAPQASQNPPATLPPSLLWQLAETLEALTNDDTAFVPPLVVLVLEDLHWSDPSTVDLLAFLARRRGAAQLLVIGSYRPAEVIASAHPVGAVKQELQVHNLCEEIQLELFSQAEVQRYVTARVGAALPASFSSLLHQCTSGNPLFLRHFIDHLLHNQLLRKEGNRWVFPPSTTQLETFVPDSLEQLLWQRFQTVPPDAQDVLIVASVAGQEFTTAAIAAGLNRDLPSVEACCVTLAQQAQFIVERGVEGWPDGTWTTRYEFLHALYPRVLYKRQSAALRIDYHLRLAECLERRYTGETRAAAANLAVHFAEGRDYQRAVRYEEEAAAKALEFDAYPEAIFHLTQGLTLLSHLPASPARLEQELRLRLVLSSALTVTRGYNAATVAPVINRAYELSQQLGTPRQCFQATLGLFLYNRNARGPQEPPLMELAKRCLRLAEQEGDPEMRLAAHTLMGLSRMDQGDLGAAQTHLEQAQTLSVSPAGRFSRRIYPQDPKTSALVFLALVQYFQGFPARALALGQEALTHAETIAHPFSIVLALDMLARLHYYRGEVQAAATCMMRVLQLSTSKEFTFRSAASQFFRGWVLMEQGQHEAGLTAIQEGRAGYTSTGALLSVFYLGLIGDVYTQIGDADAGLAVLQDAFATIAEGREGAYEAELYRLKGELLLTQTGVRPQAKGLREKEEEAERCFLKAIDIARGQQAKSLELRAVISLVQLQQQQAKHGLRALRHRASTPLKAARTMLAELYQWFTEGFDTRDLRTAKALLEELNAAGPWSVKSEQTLSLAVDS
jgi:tetratricopeptide (TPR) repeat protein